MFSRNNERQPGDTHLSGDQRMGAVSALPSTGMRDAVSMPIAPEPTARTSTESVIGKEDSFQGTLRVKRGLRVLGHVEGEIDAATSVTIEEGARVEADLTADEAIIAGEYSGKLVCRQRLEVRSTGRVKGEIETVRLMLHEGGVIDGALHMQKPAAAANAVSGTEPARAADSLRSGVSPRSTPDSAVETPAIDADRETAASGVRVTTPGSARPSSR
jgi:cytoskeletal protein CcmA (bactofilin family)